MKPGRIDVRILNAVQVYNRLTLKISVSAGLSPTACQRRLKQLRAEGGIEGDVSIGAPKEVGRYIKMLVLITLKRDRADFIHRFKNAIRNTLEVMGSFYVAGDADLVLVITSKNMESYEDFSRKLFYDICDIKILRRWWLWGASRLDLHFL